VCRTSFSIPKPIFGLPDTAGRVCRKPAANPAPNLTASLEINIASGGLSRALEALHAVERARGARSRTGFTVGEPRGASGPGGPIHSSGAADFGQVAGSLATRSCGLGNIRGGADFRDATATP
jgi:hypothetical protein